MTKVRKIWKKRILEILILYMFHIKDAPSSTSSASIAQLVRAFGC
jgi:hypothetical protein